MHFERTNKKFISRFTAMEQKALAAGRNLNDMTLEEWMPFGTPLSKSSDNT